MQHAAKEAARVASLEAAASLPQTMPLPPGHTAAGILKRSAAGDFTETALHEAVFDQAPALAVAADLAAALGKASPFSAARARGAIGQREALYIEFTGLGTQINADIPADALKTLHSEYARSQAFPARITTDDIREQLGEETMSRAAGVRVNMSIIATPPFKLARVNESAYHKIIQAWKDRSIAVPADAGGLTAKDLKSIDAVSQTAMDLVEKTGVFLLQHDWAKAFAKAKDFDGGETPALPYPITVFECRINGARVAVCLVPSPDNDSDPPLLLLYMEVEEKWVWCGSAAVDSYSFKLDRKRCRLIEGLENMADALLAQVRAVVISLEAEVAETEVIRAPYKLNQARIKKGKLPLFDYHVVNLAARKRYAQRLGEPGDRESDHNHRRLHWVRGHWRHYQDHKAWIKWHLRGDPDLGFIDKEYRL